ILGHGRLLLRAIQADQLSSLIFYGPPGTGKTTLATVIANSTESYFVTLNAVMDGVKQLREVIAKAIERQQLYNTRTTLFVDEVHRWNKSQQDALLPYVEKGIVILIGATTSNPYFEVNTALVSRSRIFQLQPLSAQNLRDIAAQTLRDEGRGYGRLQVEIEEDALEHLVNVANGDARTLLNALELAVETTARQQDGQVRITLEVAEESIQQRAVLYDKDGDAHYDNISAFIKSLRGSDADAALYWAAKMIYAGEDPKFIFRRMAIFAGEDVGLADPQAAVVVNSCWALFERIGLPEGQFPLSQAILYLATTPKSNTTLSFFDALNTVKEETQSDVPNHLKDKNRDSKGFGHGAGYKYPHAYQDHWVAQQYLPSSLQGKTFYQPSNQGYEGEIATAVSRRREEQLAVLQDDAAADESGEILTNSPTHRAKEGWLQRTMSNTGGTLGLIRDELFGRAKVLRHHLVLDGKADNGLLLWEAVRQAPEGGVWGVCDKNLDGLDTQAKRLPQLDRPHLVGDYGVLRETAVRFDHILAHNPLTRLHEQKGILSHWRGLLAENGRVTFAQMIPQMGQRIHKLVVWSEADRPLQAKIEPIEETLWRASSQSLTNWSSDDLAQVLQDDGWDVSLSVQAMPEERRLAGALVRRWFTAENSYYQALLAGGFSEDEIGRVAQIYKEQLANHVVTWVNHVAFAQLKRGVSHSA
ncbi:MAG: AAA family ATPase, partial [Sphaerospermopsis sp. SIO1G2]|nr:AAA family ATPase [Sphaerospermopsis sp. SIO1G2]